MADGFVHKFCLDVIVSINSKHFLVNYDYGTDLQRMVPSLRTVLMSPLGTTTPVGAKIAATHSITSLSLMLSVG